MQSRILLFLLALALTVAAQDVRLAEVQGEVLDMTGRPIAGARVVFSNAANGKTYTCKTGVDGRFFMIGLLLGRYQIEITGPTGRHIFSGNRPLYAGDQQKLNVIHVDLSAVPTKVSLAPFKGPVASELQKQKWRAKAGGEGDLKKDQVAELREENGLIVRYNELTPKLQSALKAQDWKVAESLLQQLVAIVPFRWEVYQNLGMVERYLGRFQEAVQSLEKGIEVLNQDEEAGRDSARRDGAVAQMLLAQGEAYAALDQQEAAAARFRKAAQIDAHPGMAYLHLCGAEYNAGHAEAALEACDQAVAAEPSRAEFYQTMATIQMNLGRYDEAIRTYEKGLQMAEVRISVTRQYHSNINSRSGAEIIGIRAEKARMGQMLLSQGYAWFQLKDYKHAADAFARSARLHPYPSLAWFNLCATRYDTDDLPGAASACESATQSDPAMADAYFVMASAWYGEASRHGKSRVTRQIRQALEKYLELAPEGAYAVEARSLLEERAAN